LKPTDYQRTINTWNSLAVLYEAKFMDMDLYNESYDHFCTLVANNKANILEIGCGPGNTTKYLLKQQPNWKLLGTDVSENMVKHAQKNNPKATFQVLDARNINEVQTKFHGIVCGFCIPFLSTYDVAIFIQNCAQLINPSGVLYLSFVSDLEGTSGYKQSSTGNRVYFNYHALSTITNLLIKAGFNLIKQYPIAIQ
jgi:trans-aconitate methyltransferase